MTLWKGREGGGEWRHRRTVQGNLNLMRSSAGGCLVASHAPRRPGLLKKSATKPETAQNLMCLKENEEVVHVRSELDGCACLCEVLVRGRFETSPENGSSRLNSSRRGVRIWAITSSHRHGAPRQSSCLQQRTLEIRNIRIESSRRPSCKPRAHARAKARIEFLEQILGLSKTTRSPSLPEARLVPDTAKVLVLVVVPAWRLYILPVVMSETLKVEERRAKSKGAALPATYSILGGGLTPDSSPKGDLAKENADLLQRNAELEASIQGHTQRRGVGFRWMGCSRG